MKKIKKSEKVKKVKKSEKVKPKVNHFLKASETPKCTFPSPLVSTLKSESSLLTEIEKKLSEIYVENPEKRARRFMAQYQHLIFPNHSMSRFHNQKASLMAELAEKNRTDPRGSDPVYWEYERAVQSIDYSQGAIFGDFFVFGRRKNH